MRRFTPIAMTTAILLACLVMIPIGAQEENPRLRPPRMDQAEEGTDADSSRHPEDRVAAEVAEIRRDIWGGGQRRPSLPSFPSLPGEAADNERLRSSEFEAAITRIAAAQPAATKTDAADPGAAQPNRRFLPDPAPSPSSETVVALRDAAWKLDQAAETLERVDLYQRADSLRQEALELRAQARQLRGPISLPDPDLVDTWPSRR